MKHEKELRDILDNELLLFMQRTGQGDPHVAWKQWEEILFLRGFKLVKAESFSPKKDKELTWTRYYLFNNNEWLWIGIPRELARETLKLGYLPD